MFYKETNYIFALQFKATYLLKDIVRDRAGVARWAHNPKVVGSNPSPATKRNPLAKLTGFYFVAESLCTSKGLSHLFRLYPKDGYKLLKQFF